jgi:hypothetical protein
MADLDDKGRSIKRSPQKMSKRLHGHSNHKKYLDRIIENKDYADFQNDPNILNDMAEQYPGARIIKYAKYISKSQHRNMISE